MLHYVMDLWQRGIDALDSRDWSGVETELDFAIKHRLLRSYQERSGAALSDPQMARLMLAYHEVTPPGLRTKMESTGLMRRLTTTDQVTKATVLPPQTTRARLRGEVIAAAQDARADLFADWVTLRLEGSQLPALMLMDPLASEDPRIDTLISTIFEQTPILPA